MSTTPADPFQGIRREARRARWVEPTPFEKWMGKVDACLANEFGVSSADIEDWGYADAYDEGVSPKRAAAEAALNAGWDADITYYS